MFILICFYNIDQIISNLTTIYNTDKINSQFLIRSKILYCLLIVNNLEFLDRESLGNEVGEIIVVQNKH